MKYCLLSFIGTVFYSCQPKKQKEANVENTNQTVKSVLESIYNPVGNDDTFDHSPKVSEHSFISRLIFNSNGLLSGESKFDSKGNLVLKAVFKYDDKGNAIQLDFYKPNGSLSTKITNTFDSSNKLIERIETTAEQKVIGKRIAKLDSNGNRIITTFNLSRGKSVKMLECAFDKTNFNVLNNYFTNEALESKDIYTYDLSGNKIRSSYSIVSAGSIQNIESTIDTCFIDSEVDQNEDALKSSEMHDYDAEGNRIETVQYFPLMNRRITTQYKYDKDRVEIATLTNSLMVSSKKVLKYDGKGNLVELFYYGIGGRLKEHQRHLYEYDQVGNWIKHKTIINNKSDAVAIRQIEYF
ncbi:MAG: hypothetical protein ACKVOQ_21530 [Cyclobacteriaceae bacterium]